MALPAANPLLAQLAGGVLDLANMIGAPLKTLPTFGYIVNGAYPCVLHFEDRWIWTIRDRGVELERRETQDVQEVLYWIFEDVTRQMATDWEIANRDEHGDPRVAWVGKQLELLEQITPRWSQRYRDERRGWLDGLNLD